MGATGGEHSICDADVLKSTSFCCRLARMDQAVDAVFPWYASPGGEGGEGGYFGVRRIRMTVGNPRKLP